MIKHFISVEFGVFKVHFAGLEIRRDVGIAPYKGPAKFALQSIKSVGASRHHNS